jgi:hypothetical protein
MSVIIRYLVDFPEAGFTISNDLFLGDFLLDATITAEMTRGTPGSAFEVKLYDLPKKKEEVLYASVQSTTLTHVKIKLGYYGSPFAQVVEGIADSVRAVVEDGKLVTIVKGLETGTHALQRTRFQSTFDQQVTVDQAIRTFIQNLTLQGGDISRTPELQNLTGTLQNKVIRGENVLVALDQVAHYAGAELLVVDKKIWVGNPIRDNTYAPDAFSPDANLGTFEPFVSDIPDENNRNVLQPLQATSAQGFTFAIAGDPKLRPGQQVSAAIDGFDTASGGEFRIHTLRHKFSVTEGYVCTGRAVKVAAGSDPNAQRRQRTALQPSADSIVDGISQISIAQRRQRPSIEIGSVQKYTPGSGGDHKHSTTLFYGQVYERTEIQPSFNAEVQNTETQRFPDKPLVSAFAWRKCGLVTPVYPGMKAVLGHNLNLEDDALVTGFMWSAQPAFDPPQNQAGDWWLCLPIDFDSSQPPTDSTKAANDLTGNDGQRVIEVKGLKITVGADKLRNVGERPQAGDADEFLIEHKKARIHISADGGIDIMADSEGNKGKISIASGGQITMQASASGVTLTVSDSAVQIS